MVLRHGLTGALAVTASLALGVSAFADGTTSRVAVPRVVQPAPPATPAPAPTPPAAPQNGRYVKFDGVTGESIDATHAGWIEIMSFQWSSTVRTGSGASTGA